MNEGDAALAPTDTPLQDPDLARPWRRWFARTLDYWLLTLPTAFAAGLLLSAISMDMVLWLKKPLSPWLVGVAIAPLVMALEALLFGLLGTTPGKWLLGVQVRTLDGRRPSLRAYLRRQVGVYLQGAGAWLPFVNLLTNLRQHRLVRAGQPASYDTGRFAVRSGPLGIVRGSLVTVAFLAILAVNGLLTQPDKSARQQYTQGGTWTNRLTGKQADIPAGWSHQTSRNQEQQDVELFFQPEAGIYAVFAQEAAPADLSLEDYAVLWARSASDTMTLYTSRDGDTVRGEPAVIVLGHMAKDETQKIHATLVKRPSAIWRLVLVGTGNRSPDPGTAYRLRTALFATLD